MRDGAGARVLLADDAPAARVLFGTLLRATAGISAVLEAVDGAAAVDIARDVHVDVAVVDLMMPRLDGVATARMLHAIDPSMPIALQSSDRQRLEQRARGLDLPLFDKLELHAVVAWVERQAALLDAVRRGPAGRRVELSCAACGYGIVSDAAPVRCPMCHAITRWAPGGRRRARRELRRRTHAARADALSPESIQQ